MTKNGLDSLTAYLHGEYDEAGLIANSARPGRVRTDLGSDEAPKSPRRVWTYPPGWRRSKQAVTSGSSGRDDSLRSFGKQEEVLQHAGRNAR